MSNAGTPFELIGHPHWMIMYPRVIIITINDNLPVHLQPDWLIGSDRRGKKGTEFFKSVTLQDFFYYILLQWQVRGEVDVDIGANPSAEGGDDDGGGGSTETKVVDLIDAFRLNVSRSQHLISVFYHVRSRSAMILVRPVSSSWLICAISMGCPERHPLPLHPPPSPPLHCSLY
jgi:hypothetical protein